jgi:hypothetical protein
MAGADPKARLCDRKKRRSDLMILLFFYLMCLQIYEFNHSEGGLFAGCQFHFGGDSRFQCLLPTASTQTPAIPILQTREVIFGSGGG